MKSILKAITIIVLTSSSVYATENKKLVDPDLTDNIPAEKYSPNSSNIQVAEKIKKVLITKILKDDLKSLDKEQRKFKYEMVDLNDDGKKEYLVSLQNSYFCGSGGCTFYLLNNDGTMINTFTVSDAPFIVDSKSTKGWKNLFITSRGKLHIVKFDGKKYPGNPSVHPLLKTVPSNNLQRLLSDKNPIPNFSF